MSLALQKTIAFLVLILVGLLLQQKIRNKEELSGIKTLILSIALPATIFVALLKIEIGSGLLLLPLLALLFNLTLFGLSRYLLPALGFVHGTAEYRTARLLFASLAPGLSCFPFIIEYLGEQELARAALADIGNKVFVLIILYLMAMRWYFGGQAAQPAQNLRHRLRGLVLSLINEPVNLVIVTALLMLTLGLRLESLPAIVQDTVGRMSALMTPLVLLFIGMAVRLRREEIRPILQLLTCRAGLAFLLCAGLLVVVPGLPTASVLLAVVFTQSAVSFWPFAHMTVVSQLEGEPARTFRPALALNLLALSLPFSTVIILLVFTLGPVFSAPLPLLLIGLALSFAPLLLQRLVGARRPSASPGHVFRRDRVFPAVQRRITSAPMHQD